MKRVSLSKILVWTLLGGSMIGLLGFGATGLTGRASTIGTVGERDLSASLYRANIANELSRLQSQGLPIDFGQAQAFGLDRQVLNRMVADATLANEAEALGLSQPDEAVAEALFQVPAFQDLGGGFDRVAYDSSLRRVGLNTGEFEENLRDEMTIAFLVDAARGAVAANPVLSGLLIDYSYEQRDILMLRRDAATMQAPEPPSDDVLRAFYETNLAAYTQPERKRITYAWLTPDMLHDDIVLDEAALRQLYEQNIDRYVRPERRLVERLAFRDRERADAAMAAIAAGEQSFEGLVEDRGLRLIDVDLGDVTEEQLEAAGPAVFAAETGDVVGPFDSPLGPALFRMNAVLAADEEPFDAVRDELAEQLIAERARRDIAQRAQGLEDQLAAGLTLEELVETSDLEIGHIDWHSDSDEDIAAYTEFGDAAAAVTMDDFPSFAPLADGGVFALRLDETLSEAPHPFEDVREQVLADWQAAEQLTAAQAWLEALAPDADLASLGAEEVSGLTRGEFLEAVPEALVEQAFALEQGEVAYVTGENAAWRVELLAVTPPDLNTPEVAAQMARTERAIAASLAGDLEQALLRALQSDLDITLNQPALNAVHSSLQ